MSIQHKGRAGPATQPSPSSPTQEPSLSEAPRQNSSDSCLPDCSQDARRKDPGGDGPRDPRRLSSDLHITSSQSTTWRGQGALLTWAALKKNPN